MFVKSAYIFLLALTSVALAVPAPVSDSNDLLMERTVIPDVAKRQEVHCAYGQVCWCQKSGIKFTCQNPAGCDLDCPNKPIIPKS
ncbi:hypothetical protein I302_106087 [Kwoniella bestiolae CBS 10118]|uniref:Long chronological lifespan protein 2 n=1 Tax=Kwoniella bestiolae CBS 10118 TaxID=1296100 RepID=A0A1B9G2Z8_9TREE|nr:hypothetical protein I302_05213 [Kwoniella bestiolae CBS 10118]OCF25394.1 hypothetical protein I302_05213 [Kwoniella bestiolae CBS 10118]